MNNTSNNRVLRVGGYGVVSTVIVLAIVIFLNLAVGILPSRFVKYNTSSNDLYGITDTSKKLISAVKDKITVNIVVENGYEDEIIAEYVKRYAELNSNIKVNTVDPVVKPSFVSTYTDDTLTSQYTNLIVVNETKERSRVIKYNEIYTQKYTQQEMYYYQMMGYNVSNPTYFNIEQKLTSALDYVTADITSVIYYTSGHGETAATPALTELIDAENIGYKELKLVSVSAVPEDAKAVFINAPTKDLSKEETDKLKAYFEAGGNIVLTSFYNEKAEARKLENLYAFTSEMGLEYTDLRVCEGNSDNYCYSNSRPLYNYILPELSQSSLLGTIPENTEVLMIDCHPISIKETLPEGVSVTELLTTTVKGYTKGELGENEDLTKKDTDPEGKLTVGAMAEKKKDSTTSRLIWFSSNSVADTSWMSQFSNISYFMSVVTGVCEKETPVVIESKLMQVEALKVGNTAAKVWGAVFIAVIPLAFLGSGFAVWSARKKR